MDMNFNSFSDIPVPVRMAFIAVICAVIAYFCYMVDFSYLLRVIHNNQKKEDDLKTSLQVMIDGENTLQNSISDLPALFSTLVQWQGQLIKPTELPDLLSEILRIGTGNNLQFDLFSPGDKVKVDLYYKLPIKIVVSGSYNQIADFISQIANMKKLVAISNFGIMRKDLDKKLPAAAITGALIAEINLEVYYRAGLK
jgi:type IV pilus assembly protein PilO